MSGDPRDDLRGVRARGQDRRPLDHLPPRSVRTRKARKQRADCEIFHAYTVALLRAHNQDSRVLHAVVGPARAVGLLAAGFALLLRLPIVVVVIVAAAAAALARGL